MVGETLRNLLMIAWLLPLVGFAVEIFGGFWGSRKSRLAAWLAVGCIATGFLCSASALVIWGRSNHWVALEHRAEDHHSGEGSHEKSGTGEGDEGHEKQGAVDQHGAVAGASLYALTAMAVEQPAGEAHGTGRQTVYSGTLYYLARFGGLDISIDYYIDSLTLVMFTMVTFIATCIHLFAMGYMSEELTEDYVDHHAHLSNGHHLHRPGRFYRFFAFMSLFCFSMLGLVLAGNIFQVFVFWELVGICSFLLIGFYTERKSASNAANKAFIMNRVGDFGFLIGLMVLWTFFGTFRFGETVNEKGEVVQAGLFQLLDRDAAGHVIRDSATGDVVIGNGSAVSPPNARHTIPYYLLVVAGLGVFAGCIGKSAQFPLQTWLPDAMEGPTPVSALVHSATMVAAGVYLVGRFYPMFVQEVLLTIAYVGCITLFLAATIAVVATDIKKVLAYSTISQLGYMMLGLGVFGWGAGLFHLITHAFFKSLMFLCSGSVIYGCHHEQEMPKMGGLWRKMPITALTMLIGVIAISGLAIPGLVSWCSMFAFSGFFSKDAIVATSLAFMKANPSHFLLFVMPLLTAGITAFYMFRLWFYTFAGKPRDRHVYDHCHESPLIMTLPLVVLSVLAAFCAIGGEDGPLYRLITGDQPGYIAHGIAPVAGATSLTMPDHDAIHNVHGTAGALALIAAASGTLIAWVLYGTAMVNVSEIKRQLAGLHAFLVNKWMFDDLYDALFVKPAHIVGKFCAWFDRTIFDGIIHASAKIMILVSKWDRLFDETVVDGFVNLLGNSTFAFGRSLRAIQTGRLRQYVMFIVVGVVALFAILFTTFPG
jgi:NADH-quinone oxidoreductase subunit L